MEKQVLYRDRQEIQSEDFNNAQTFTANSLAHLVIDAITAERMVTGLQVGKKSATELEIAPGRLWDGVTGKIYEMPEAQTVSVFSQLPLIDKKYLALCVIGQEQDTDMQVRDFLIDLQTGQTQPQNVAMQRARIAVVHAEIGLESPTPQKPSAPTGYTLIAHVLLDTTGIASIETSQVSVLPRLFELNVLVQSIERWRRGAEPRISTLASDVAGLYEAIAGLANRDMIKELAGDVSHLKEMLHIPDTYSSYGADYLLDSDESDTTNPDYYARAEEGIRFPFAAKNEVALELFNPFEVSVKNHTGFILPAYDDVPRLATNGYAGELALSQYQFQTHTMRQGTITRRRDRYGPTRTICTNSQEWRSGAYDPATNIFRNANGDTWKVAPEDVPNINKPHYIMRQQQYWVDSYDEAYWYVDSSTTTINGAQVAQTILNSQNGWLTKIGLFFTKKATDGIVYLHLCETQLGLPDVKRCVGSVQLHPGDMKSYPEETTLSFPRPVFLEAGKRYALVLTTGGDHKLAIVAGENYTQGTLFYSLDGEYFQGDFTKDLQMRLYFAAFKNPRTVVELKPLQLAGGIADIDILAPTYVPPSTQLIYEYQKDGVWHAIDAVTQNNPLLGLPAMVHLRAVFIGSSDLMPGLGLENSRALVSRQATTFRHISTARTTPAPTKNIEVQARLEYFNTAKHQLGCSLIVNGANIAPSATVVKEEPGGLRKTFTFALATATSSFKIRFDGETSTPLDVFHVASRTDIAK